MKRYDTLTNKSDQILVKRNKSVEEFLVVSAFCLFLSVVFSSIGTKSSPLYPFNDWVDANASFTMGKAMIKGKILYRDIFDQRGPLFYLLFGLAYLISNTSFLGVFIFEVLSFSVFLYFSFKLVSLFLDFNYALISLPLLTTSIINLKSFTHGGSPEEFSLPLIAISLYYLVVYFKDVYPKPIPNRYVFVNGIIAGCVLWIKFSMLGFWFGWMASIFLSMLITKQIFPAIKSAILFILGMLAVTLPWIIYFSLNHSIYEWINAYFIINLTSYSEATSVMSNITSIPLMMITQLGMNPIFAGHFLIGLIIFLTNIHYIPKRIAKISLLSCLLFLALSVFGGGRGYIYYFLIISPFIIFGFIVLLSLFYKQFGAIKSRLASIFIILISVIITFSYTLVCNHNTYMLKMDKEDLVQFKYAKIIRQTENATLLNYGTLDIGFYTTTGIVPNVRFFQNLNIPYSAFPLVMDEQNRYIKEKVVDFITLVVPSDNNFENPEIPSLYENYSLIEKELQAFENIDYYYLLFEKKN